MVQNYNPVSLMKKNENLRSMPSRNDTTPKRHVPHGISLLLLLLLFVRPGLGQVDEARQAIDREEYVRAVNILSNALADRPTADIYLYLGIAYRHMKEYQKAEEIFNDGSLRYPDDSRFLNELANLFLENNDIESAKSALRRALAVDPANNYASDELATINMSEGDVQSALRSWNKSGRPYINDILHNYNVNLSSWVVRRAVTFHPGGTLRYSDWKTTESRLFATDNFANVGLEIEPTQVPDQYNAVVRTSPRTNSPADILFDLFKGVPIETSYLDFWNIGNTGMNFNGNYRWAAERRRAQGQLRIALPVAGLLYVDLGNLWRSEQWNVSQIIRPELLSKSQFLYKATAWGVQVKNIPNYRVELGGGFQYRNRAARGELPQLFTNNLNVGEFNVETNLRLVDGNYQNRLHVEAYAARRSIIGDATFTRGVAELDNRVTVSKDSQMYFDWSIKGGTARGALRALPVEDYFVLGVDITPMNLLRGHNAARHGKYGNGPMGTDFVLLNTDIDRRLKTIPFFNNFGIPFITVKAEFFFDAAKTWDRNDVFQPSKLLLDTGVGLRLETPTSSFNLIYGRPLRGGPNVFAAYYERRLW
jgi:tetratricopeptide (TPR) repeat protein